MDVFYKVAVEAGDKRNGPPGLRPQYHANYHAALVRDSIGKNVGALCNAPA